MKKILYSIITVLGIISASSCGDMLESESSRQVYDPALNQKTDSVYYANGVLQAVQQLADQYFFQNEMRGELVKTTSKANLNLKNLASYSAGAENKYDSVYLYYKVINNCNYYLQHRDTTLQTGAVNVTIGEYAAIATYRAWAYLQLGRQYGKVPYVTEPVTTIAQINSNTDAKDYQEIFASQAAYLEKLKQNYSEDQLDVPTYDYANTSFSVGKVNWGSSEKWINPSKCFIPLNIVLGDLYLEIGEYAKAATCYYQYLYHAGYKLDADGRTDNSGINVNMVMGFSDNMSNCPLYQDMMSSMPVDFNSTKTVSIYSGSYDWQNSFSHGSSMGDVITYIPMAVNYTKGKTTEIPAAFGYDYYATERGSLRAGTSWGGYDCPLTADIQVVPSEAYADSAKNSEFYYYTEQLKVTPFNWIVKNEKLGDMRSRLLYNAQDGDSAQIYVYKPSTAYVTLYRTTTVWLHLAEALNRMGYPDAAFAVLKNGLHADLANFRYQEVYELDANGKPVLDENGNQVLDLVNSHIDDKYYITPETWEFLTTTLPMLAPENTVFKNGANKAIVGIHFHGAGVVDDLYSTYRYNTVVGAKLQDINNRFKLNLTEYTKDDYINAVEDLLCDEYAMEFAFEGTRFSDLRRIAMHKNRCGLYGGNFGSIWFAEKMKGKNVSKDLTVPENWYLPFK